MRSIKSIKERLLEKIIKDKNGCWNWTAFINKGGYSIIMIQGKPRRGHRISYEEFIGEIPHKLDLDHLCRNRKCINPKHLEPVTRKENLRRSPLKPHLCGGAALAKIKKSKTHCLRGHPYTGQNLKMSSNGKWRVCRECNRMHGRDTYLRSKSNNAHE